MKADVLTYTLKEELVVEEAQKFYLRRTTG
ncbi:hypothetical protein SAMN05216283_109100 [Sunxiuqinia elliptica]|uniref:Uncharacterized protein n=1 Tax=Sunxiuqinia elliptica TaxID=655355 RepID=A0A1I2JN36_9BACT|nr:hypothetical protein SAMN05216283_109100 [Sunxiuqinia elliptica]